MHNRLSILNALNAMSIAALVVTSLKFVLTGNAFWLMAPLAVFGALAGRCAGMPRFGLVLMPTLIAYVTMLFPHFMRFFDLSNLTEAREFRSWRFYETAIGGTGIDVGLLWPYIESYAETCREKPHATFLLLTTSTLSVLVCALIADARLPKNAAEQRDKLRVAEP